MPTRRRIASRPTTEPLERRALLSASLPGPVPLPIDISRLAGPEAEGTIAIDPSNPKRLFAASNRTGGSLFGAVSSDGGATWAGREFATGMDGLPRACCDPSAAWDEFGNLFFTYLNAVDGHIEMLVSTDGGTNFNYLGEFKEEGDQPTVVAGGGAVWVGYQEENNGAVAYHAKVTGLGQVGKFGKAERIIGGAGQNVADIAIGPAGQVLVAYQQPGVAAEAPGTIAIQLDLDGLGPKKFAKPIPVGNTNVGDFDKIPAQIHRSIDAEVGLAYDRSGGPFTGRVYMVYTDETPDESNNTDIFLRYSDNDGQDWSDPVRINDDNTVNSQFLPRLAVDPTTGSVAVVWHDCREDLGVPNQGSRDAVANNDAEFYGAVGSPTPDGVTFSPNFRISAGVSTTATTSNPNDYGDYTGVAFVGGLLHPVWADNSNSTHTNPDGAGGPLDLYTSTLTVQTTPPPTTAAPLARLMAKPTAGKGKSYAFTVAYTDLDGDLNPATLDVNDVVITSPNGFAFQAQLARVKRKGDTVTATYKFAPPGGPRSTGPGQYVISLQPNQVTDLAGNAAAARTRFGTFVV